MVSPILRTLYADEILPTDSEWPRKINPNVATDEPILEIISMQSIPDVI